MTTERVRIPFPLFRIWSTSIRLGGGNDKKDLQKRINFKRDERERVEVNRRECSCLSAREEEGE